jgi:Rrf2 family protein
MRLSARVDYALRAMAELAAADEGPVKSEFIAASQGIPPRFLERILGELRRSGMVASQRGADGGYWLARPAHAISLADVIRAIEGPLAEIHGTRPEGTNYRGAATAYQEVWIALRASERRILETVSLADIATGSLPAEIDALTRDPEAWLPH